MAATLQLLPATPANGSPGLLSPASPDTSVFRWEGSDEDEEELFEETHERASGQWGRPGDGMADRRSSVSAKLAKRRVYGGGRHGEEGGTMGVSEVAGLILAATLGPTPLLMPHAAALLGLPLFLGFLFVCAILSWFSFVVLGVEARYVGARSWPALSSAVFPHRFKVHRLGEVFTGALIGFCSVGRGVVGVLAASEIVVDLVLPYVVGQEGKQTWMYVAAVTTIALSWVLVPLVLYPCMRYFLSRRRPSSSLGLSRFSSILAFTLYPLALLLLGVRLQTLNRPETPSLELLATLNATLPLLVPHAPFSTASTESEAMGLSIWGGIALIVFSFSSHASTFTFLSSLARPESTRTTRSPSIRRLGSFAPPIQSGGATSNQWPLAAFLGVFLSMLLHLGFGLVGYLGIEQGGTTGNILLEPIFDSEGPGGKDFWLVCARSAILLVLLAGLEGSVEVAVEQVRKGLGGLRGATRENGLEYEQMHSSLPHSTSPTRSNAVGFEWTQSLARVTVWSIMGVVSGVLVRMGREGEGMVSAAEVCACVGNSLVGFLGPSIFFIALFHLRKPRSIFISDPTSPIFSGDTLLLKKERQVQSRLSGKRIWQDFGVFGGLLPFGIILLVRGAVALVRKEYT